MKIFWEPAAHASNPEQAFSIEHLTLPRRSFVALHAALQQNEQLLPASARKFQHWRVSLLRRFDYPECGLEAPITDEAETATPVEPFPEREVVDIRKIPGAQSLFE